MADILRETKDSIHFIRTQGLDYPPHIHADVELVWVLEGGGTVYCDGREHTLRPGCCFLAFPQQVHHYAGCAGDYILAIFKPERLQHYAGQLTAGVHRHGCVLPAADPARRVEALLTLALEEYTARGDSPILDGYFTAIMGSLLANCPAAETAGIQDCLATLLRYCGEHYREPLSVNSVATALHISPSHISHTFSRRLGMGFTGYIHALRLSEAAGLLAAGRLTVTAIAYQVGYNSLRTFNRAFRQRYGVSPAAYRKQPPGLHFSLK